MYSLFVIVLHWFLLKSTLHTTLTFHRSISLDLPVFSMSCPQFTFECLNRTLVTSLYGYPSGKKHQCRLKVREPAELVLGGLEDQRDQRPTTALSSCVKV
ncbi:hypothetical protein AMECASPLE_011341 [Ameca splendens]|uniref:Secreted protein n=1 Tax=Ameca splendens TaxID=208324 RepID=A0ABV0YBV6_9TELE